ncbi:MAG TPA: MFS transporter [Burkholderiaceae bacterium]|nr:MFS transporter [Burkholderiaceae bacterium]
MASVLEQPLQRDAEVIGLVGIAHASSHFFQLVLPPLFPWLMKDFGLSFTQAGFLMTVFFVISGVGQAVAGFVVDRLGARPVLLFGVGTAAFSGVVLGFAASFSGLVAAAAVAGVGNCIFHPADFTLLNRRVSPPRLGHAFSVHGLAGNLGWAVAPVSMAGIASIADWHAAAFSAAAAGAVIFLLLLARRDALDDRTAETVLVARAVTEEPVASSKFGFLRSGAVWMCFLFFFCITAAFGVLQTYAPAILGDVYGLPLALATASLTAYLIGSAAGTVLGGFVAARTEDSDRVIGVALGAAAVLALVLAWGGLPAWCVIPLMVGMGFGGGVAGPSRDLLVRRAATARFGRSSYGRIYGFVYSGLDVGVAATPLVFGPLLDHGRFSAALVGVAVLQCAALASAARVGRRVRGERAMTSARA